MIEKNNGDTYFVENQNAFFIAEVLNLMNNNVILL